MVHELVMSYKMAVLKNKWKKKNKMNFTYPKCFCDIDKIDIGNYTYGGIDAESFGCKESHLSIGHYCSISKNVRFILDGEHYYHRLSTYPFKVRLFGEKCEAICRGPIIIKDDVWIGERTIILSGVTIGQGAIIGAGSVVRKDIPPYAIYAGGRIVKKRFDDNTIDELLKLDYSKLSAEKAKQLLDVLYKDVSELDGFSIW